jgi:predicted nucleic acid-binding protein
VTLVCDAGPLIHLDELGCLTLLKDFRGALVPDAVWQEVLIHRPSALSDPDVQLTRIRVADRPVSPALTTLVRLFGLHRGEQEALQLAQQTPDCLLLTDDTAARLAAANINISVHGTIGLLVRALRREQKTKDEVLRLLISLPSKTTLHVRRDFLQQIIMQIRDRQ